VSHSMNVSTVIDTGEFEAKRHHQHPNDKYTVIMTTENTFRNAALLSALTFISTRPDHYYPSPKSQPKRASVAMIIWIKPPEGEIPPVPEQPSTDLFL